MKKLITIIIVLAVLAGLYFLLKPDRDIISDPRVQKFAKIQAEIEIEAERLDHDSMMMQTVRDSIYKRYDVASGWVDRVEAMIDRQPEKWVEVYDLMIKHAESIRDSILHRKPIRSDSI